MGNFDLDLVLSLSELGALDGQVFCCLRCQPGLSSAQALADMFRAMSVAVR